MAVAGSTTGTDFAGRQDLFSRDRKQRTLLLALLIAAGILNYADRQIIALLKPVLQQELRWTDADYGQLGAAFQFASAIAFPLAGWFVDRVGPVWANPLAVGSWSLAAMAHAFAVSLPQFLGARIALGATEAMGTPTAIKTLAAMFDAKGRSLALGVMNASTSLGAILTPLFLPSLALALGWRNTFLVTGGCGIFWAFCWIPLVRRQTWIATKNEEPTRPPIAWRSLLADRRTWAVAGAKALSDQAWWFLLFWTPDLLHRTFHLDLGGVALPLATIYLMAAFGALAGGMVSGRLLRRHMSVNKARKLTMLGSALLMLPVPLVLSVDNTWTAVGLLGLTLAGHQGFSVNLFALITDIVPNERVASVTSIGALFGNLAGMLVLQVTGWVLAAGGSYLPMLSFTACAYLLALLWIHLLLPVLRPVAPQARFA